MGKRKVSLRKLTAMSAAASIPTVAAGVALPAEPAAAYKPYHYSTNICGAKCNQGNVGMAMYGPLWTTFQQEGNPYTVGVQEACNSQSDNLKGWLTDRDGRYRMRKHHQMTVGRACSRNSGTMQFGVAMIAISNNSPASAGGAFLGSTPG